MVPSCGAFDSMADLEGGGREGGEGGEVIEVDLRPVPEGNGKVGVLLWIPLHRRHGFAWFEGEKGRVLLLLLLVLLLLQQLLLMLLGHVV
jgi:hypothetical protein